MQSISGRVSLVTFDSVEAANRGLAAATSEWVGFAGAGDKFDPVLLEQVDRFLTAQPDVDAVTCHRAYVPSGGGEPVELLPRQFVDGDRTVDLALHPSMFCESAIGTFFPRARLAGLRFDPAIPRLAPIDFVVRYLIGSDSTRVGFLATASVTSGDPRGEDSDPDEFTMLPGALLVLLREAHGADGRAPGWLQSLVVFNLGHRFAWADRPAGALSAAQGEVADTFHEVLAQICRELDPPVIDAFVGKRFPEVWRDYLTHAYADTPWHSARVIIGRRDPAQQLVRVEYRFTGTRPREEFVVDGRAVEPVYAKVRALPYFDRDLLHHRLAWVPEGELEVRLNGVGIDVHRPKPRRREAPAGTWQDRLTRRLARTALARQWFSRAWVLMDRTHDADDSGEHLFRYLRASQPDVNAWFVIEAGTPDHARLRADFGRRVVEYGSRRWQLLMANAEHLISSHADAAIVRPALLRPVVPEPRWRFTFLNHGVIKDDLSGWLNAQDIEIFVTSTTGEYESVCGDGTAYLHTRKEAQLTGMPRFDRVREAGSRFPPEARDLILIAPTWRSWLVAQAAPGSQRRVLVPGFAETDFAREWGAVLRSPELASLAASTGLQVATLLHPNLAAVSDELGLPEHVTQFGFEGTDVRELFARARVLVTDYSSMAFNAAYIDRPVVYFQFDHAQMFGGAHVGRRGYFDYARDGYGPVTFTAPEAVGAVSEIVERGPAPAPEYAARIAEAFPQRDGRCSERVYLAIRASVESPGQSEKVSTGATRARPA